MNLYIIRHGETDWNKTRRMQGKTDIPLNAFGIHLAKETGKGLENIEFAAVYTSPLSRAADTARMATRGRMPLIFDDRLLEMGFGEYEGLSTGKDTWNIPDPEFHNYFNAPEHYEAKAGGESFEEVAGRVGSFMKELLENKVYENQNVLISTHGAILCVLLNMIIKGKPVSRVWDGGVHKNCAVTIVKAENGTYEVLQENYAYYKDEVKPW